MIQFEQAVRAVEILQQMGYRAEVINDHEVAGQKFVALGSTAPGAIAGYALTIALMEGNQRVAMTPVKAAPFLPSVSEDIGRSTLHY